MKDLRQTAAGLRHYYYYYYHRTLRANKEHIAQKNSAVRKSYTATVQSAEIKSIISDSS